MEGRMDEQIRVALIGCGSVSQRGLLPHLAQEDAREIINLVAVCDVVEDRARETAERFQVPEWYTQFGDLLARADVDAVLIATPIPYHYEQAMAAIEAGKHVHLQKTMTTTLAEADRLVEAARQKRVKLVASPGQMLSPVSQGIKRMIEAEGLGKVYWAIASTSWIGHEYEPFRGESPVDPTWYYKPGGGPVYDMSVYTLHTLTGILGPVRRVTAMSGIGLPVRQWGGRDIKVEMDDNTLLLLDFGNGCFAIVGGHFCQMGRVIGWGFTGIYGSDGALEITGLASDTAYPAQIEFTPADLAEKLDVHEDARGIGAVPYIAGVHTQIEEAHLWADIRHLVDCILHDEEPIPSAEHARHVIEIIEKGYIAARTGQVQDLRTTF
jgi:predicted dehydrogenase